MNRTDKRLSALLHKMVQAEPLPVAPVAAWLAQGPEAASSTITAHWPEELQLKAPTRLISLAASLALALWLALVQLSGWVNPIDVGANRLLADEGVRQNLQGFLHRLFGA